AEGPPAGLAQIPLHPLPGGHAKTAVPDHLRSSAAGTAPGTAPVLCPNCTRGSLLDRPLHHSRGRTLHTGLTRTSARLRCGDILRNRTGRCDGSGNRVGQADGLRLHDGSTSHVWLMLPFYTNVGSLSSPARSPARVILAPDPAGTRPLPTTS